MKAGLIGAVGNVRKHPPCLAESECQVAERKLVTRKAKAVLSNFKASAPGQQLGP